MFQELLGIICFGRRVQLECCWICVSSNFPVNKYDFQLPATFISQSCELDLIDFVSVLNVTIELFWSFIRWECEYGGQKDDSNFELLQPMGVFKAALYHSQPAKYSVFWVCGRKVLLCHGIQRWGCWMWWVEKYLSGIDSQNFRVWDVRTTGSKKFSNLMKLIAYVSWSISMIRNRRVPEDS